MSLTPDRWTELEELMGALRDGLLTPEQADVLEERLVADPDARTYYLEYITLCATLRHYQGQSSPEEAGPRGTPAPTLDSLSIAPEPPRRAKSSWRDLATRRLPWLAIAAAGLLAVVLIPGPWRRGGGVIPTPTPRPTPAPVGPVLAGPPPAAQPAKNLAFVVKLDDVRWGPGESTHPTEGAVLTPGRIRFAAGQVTLSFFSGVTLTLEGPADVDLVALDRVFCRRGKLRARVPKGAEGFVVATERSAVVDLGTEFGLNVEDDGKSRVMVFEGAASAALLDAEGSPHRTQLVERSKAFELDPRTGRIAETAAVPEGFVPAPTLTAPSLVLDPFYPSAVLRSRPSGYWRFESLRGGAVPNEVPDGRPLRVSGPVGIDGGARGNGCARFPAGSPGKHLFTDGLWELARDPGHAVELWFLSDGVGYSSLVGLFPPREMNLPDQRQRYLHTFLVELTAQGRQSLHKPASVRFQHRWPLDVKVEFNVYSEEYYVPRRWHHVVAQKNGDRMELYLDGEPARSLTLDPDHPTLPCHLVVGRRTPESGNPKDSRSFVGRLDELALYDHPLTDEEVRQHYRLATQAPLSD